MHVFQAGANNQAGVLLGSTQLPSGAFVRGLAVDRTNGRLYVASESAIFRSSLATWPLSFAIVYWAMARFLP